MRAGDVIVAANGVDFCCMAPGEALGLLRRTLGSSLPKELRVLRRVLSD